MADTEFFNLYVERVVTEVTELTKTKMILETRILYTERSLKVLQDRIVELEKELAEKKTSIKKKPTPPPPDGHSTF